MKENNSKVDKIEVIVKKLKILTERLVLCCICLLILSAVLQFTSIFFPDFNVIIRINVLLSLLAVLFLFLILVNSTAYLILQSKVRKNHEEE